MNYQSDTGSAVWSTPFAIRRAECGETKRRRTIRYHPKQEWRRSLRSFHPTAATLRCAMDGLTGWI